MTVMGLRTLFTEHPQSVGETYAEHMVRASWFGGRMIVAGLACMVHALLPFVFVRTGSQAIEELNARMLATRRTMGSQTPVINVERLPLR
jgi:Family of unknown function (DUF6356)